MPLFRKSSNNKICGNQQQQQPKLPPAPPSLHQELRIAASQGNFASVTQIIRKGALIVPDRDGRTAMHLAAMGGHEEVLVTLLEHGTEPNVPDKLGYTSLHRATIEGHAESVRLLIEGGALLDKQDYVHENTCLHEAAARGHVKILKLLLTAEGNMYTRNKSGGTALHSACQNGQTSCARLLLKHGCKPNPLDKYDDTPLHTAVRYLHQGATQILLSYGAKLNEQNKNGDSPLHLSCNLGQRKLTRILLQAGANPTLRNKQGETCLAIALRKKNAELVEIVSTTKKQPQVIQTAAKHADKISWKKRARHSKIRERLKAARESESKWQLLFQDWPSFKNTEVNNWNERNRNLDFSSLRQGEQYFFDLAGNVQKGPSGPGGGCFCTPFLCQIAKQNTEAQQELLDEIDACHDQLSHEISDLRQVTKCYLSDLKRRLVKKRQQQTDETIHSQEDIEGRGREGGEKKNLFRSRSESELETDVERERIIRCATDQSDSLSNASDDLYLDHYWRCGEQSLSSSQDSQSRGSSKRSTGNKRQPVMAAIQETFQETMLQFNRLDLDDSCTTPTSASSQPYTNGGTRCEDCNVSIGRTSSVKETDKPGHESHPTSLYSCQSISGLNLCPQPPSLDSGYGTGISPSPLLRPTDPQCSLPRSLPRSGSIYSHPPPPNYSHTPPGHISEASTQTYTSDKHEYEQLEALVRPLVGKTNRFSPMFTIPPPPQKPLPPIPHSKPKRKSHSHQQKPCLTTNV